MRWFIGFVCAAVVIVATIFFFGGRVRVADGEIIVKKPTIPTTVTVVDPALVNENARLREENARLAAGRPATPAAPVTTPAAPSGSAVPAVGTAKYTELKSGWEPKNKTTLSCAGVERGKPFACDKAFSKTEICICP